ncbi:MAG: sigma-54 dependent transcriptional regulator [Lentisphaerae bacterium]|nr:sigma-54 dependent transcriptional regulator [Lentisphaerota bacterium]
MVENSKSESTLQIAVLDDDRRVATTMAALLRTLGGSTRVYFDPAIFLTDFDKSPVDIVISDLQMPGYDGLTVLRRVKARSPTTDVIIVTGAADKKSAIEALKEGAFDFFEKPVDGTELVETIRRTVRYRELLAERDRLAGQLAYVAGREAERWSADGFVGTEPCITRCLDDVRMLAKAPGTSVLITGESGTGKELVARAIHFGSTRCERPFVPVNCSAVPSELAESTLFGHVKGAFTGAVTDKKGSFDLADGGTLFLDEIGDMPAAMQAKLLRVLEDGMVTPVGATRTHSVNVRVLAATNSNLEERIAAKGFRADLFFRLAHVHIKLPPLRERPRDIPLLVQHFGLKLSTEMGLAVPVFTPEAMAVLERHPYPGNVRELKNMVERALIECGGGPIRPAHIHAVSFPAAGPTSPGAETTVAQALPLNLRSAEAQLIRRAMVEAGGNTAAAARLLGINRTKLYRKLAMMPHE